MAMPGDYCLVMFGAVHNVLGERQSGSDTTAENGAVECSKNRAGT